jgi:cation-transporting ATPase 13A2
MSQPTSPGLAEIPSTTSPVKQRKDPFKTIFQAGSSTHNQIQDRENQEDNGPKWDYTENAPQGVVDAIAIERAREEQEGPPDMISGSVGSWGMEQGMFAHVSLESPEIIVVRSTELMVRRTILPEGFYTSTWLEEGFDSIKAIRNVWTIRYFLPTTFTRFKAV